MKHIKRRNKPNQLIKILIAVFFILAVLVGYMFLPSQSKQFQTLSQISLYTKSTEEFPGIDNNDRLKPDYTTFLKSITPSFLNAILRSIIPFIFEPKWDIQQFKELLNTTIKKQNDNGYTGNYALKLTPAANTKLVIFGDLFGSMHSLVRDLEKLKELNIINDKLEIMKPNHYIIFNGNIINLSAYSLETINIVLILMQRNPNKVFYLTGTHEYKNYPEYGFHTGLDKEIEIKNSNYRNEKNSLKTILIRFFDTLPLAIYINTSPLSSTDFIRISNLNSSTCSLINESIYADLLKQKSSTLLKIKINSNEKAKSSINLKSVISSIDRRTNPLPTTGLLKLPDVKNAATWDITSSPNSTYRSLFDFFYDAFCILSFDNNNWTISLYNQDTRNATGFNKTDFELYKKSIPNSESNSTQLVSSKNKPTKDIYVGAILGISGWIQELDTKTLEGLNLRFNKCNELNELKNKKIQLVYADHQYDPALALMQMQKLYAQYKVDMFIRFVGTDMVKACLNFMNNNNIYSLFPSISFSFAKIEDQKNIIYLKNHFEDEASALVNYSIKNLLCKKFALFYQNDEFGKGMLNAAVSVLEKKGIPQNKYLVLPQPRSSADATKAAELITKFEPECVFCFIVPVPVINLISKITTSSVKYYLGTSSTEHRNLREFIRDKGVKYIFSHVFPNTNDPSITIVKEYLTELKKINQQPEGYSFAAYVSADLLVETIKQIAEPVTTEKIINKLRAIKNYNFKGINLNYNAKNLCLSNDIWIETEDGTWLYLPTNSEGTPK